MITAPKHQFLWLAIETSHADAGEGVILELAAALAEDDRGGDLSVVQEWSWAVDFPADIQVDEEVSLIHLNNGLIEEPDRVPLSHAEAVLAGVLGDANGVVLAGLTASWTLPWVKRHMPLLAAHIAHGVLDVGSLNRAAKAWHPEGFRAHYVKAGRALPKVHAALAAARHWRAAVGL